MIPSVSSFCNHGILGKGYVKDTDLTEKEGKVREAENPGPAGLPTTGIYWNDTLCAGVKA